MVSIFIIFMEKKSDFFLAVCLSPPSSCRWISAFYADEFETVEADAKATCKRL